MSSPEYFRKQAEALFNMAKAAPADDGKGLIYTMRALECLARVEEAESGEHRDTLDAHIIDGDGAG
jgi:hypothetical protein